MTHAGARALRNEEGRALDVDRPTASSARWSSASAAGSRRSASQRGDNVAIVSNNRVEWAVAAYACYGARRRVRADVRGAAPQGVGVHRPRLRGQGPLRRQRRDPREGARAFARLGPVAQAHRRAARRGTNGASRRATRSRRYASLLGLGQDGAVASSPARATRRASSTRAARPATPRASSSRTRNIASNVSAVHEIFPMEQRGPVALVPALGARLRADGRAPPLLLARRVDGHLRGRRQDPRQPRRGAAHAALQRAAHLQQDLHGGAAADRRASPRPSRSLVEGRPQGHGEGARGRAPQAARARAPRAGRQASSSRRCARASAGGSSTPSPAARRSRARWPSSSTRSASWSTRATA